MKRQSLPRARMLAGASALQPVRSRLRSAGRALLPTFEELWVVVVGFWPLWAVTMLALGLIWAFAVGESP